MRYTAYGLGIESCLALPELPAAEAGSDLVVVTKPGAGAATRSRRRAAQVRPGHARLAWPGAGTFLVRHGREIAVTPSPRVRPEVLRLFLLGPVLAVALHQRGRFVLHASAVVIGGVASAFLGGPRWGKSTTAAALHARGHPLVADDVLAIDDSHDPPAALPGIPQLKLWPDASAAVGADPATLPRVHPRLEKRVCPTSPSDMATPIPMRRLYVLAPSPEPEPRIEPLAPQAALIELMRHSYAARALHREQPARHFTRCAALASRLPVRRLVAPRSLGHLGELSALIENDVGRADA